MLDYRRALSAPKLLILDEPTEGVAPVLIDRIEDALRLLFAEMRLGVLLIEQNLDFAFAMAQRGYVMEKGQIVLEAPIGDLRQDAVEQYRHSEAEPRGSACGVSSSRTTPCPTRHLASRTPEEILAVSVPFV